MSLDFVGRAGKHFDALKRQTDAPLRAHIARMPEVPLTPRRALLLVASIAILVAAACTAAPIASSPSIPSSGPASTAPVPTPIPVPSVIPAPPATPTPAVDEGNVEGDVYPELAVEAIDAQTLRVTLDDPSAKAWRLVIAGDGDLRYDRLEIEVVTSDVAPLITAREMRDSEVVSEMDLSGFAYGGAAGGCHATLGVCIDSDGFRLPKDSNGRFRFRLSIADATGPLAITGSTAGWPGEPFILGRWVDTDTLNWSA